MHDLPAAEIDADVRVPPPPFVEEHQVPPPQARHPDAGRGASLLLRVARQCHAGLPEAVLYEPAAIETLSGRRATDRKSTRLNSSHGYISYAVFCLKKKREI